MHNGMEREVDVLYGLGDGTDVTEEEISALSSSKEEPVGALEVSLPHWELDSSAFKSAITVFKEFLATSFFDAVTSSLFMGRVGQVLVLRGTNGSTFLEIKVPIENRENILSAEVVVSIKDLVFLVAFSGTRMCIAQDGETFKVFFHTGEVVLDSKMIEKETYNFPQVPQNLKEISVANLTAVLPRFIEAVKLSVRPEDRKITILNGRAVGDFIVASFLALVPNLDDMVLRLLDMRFLLRLLFGRDRVSIAWEGNNLFFVSEEDGCKISFQVSKPSEDDVSSFVIPENVKPFDVEVSVMKSIIQLASSLSNQIPTVSFVSQEGSTYACFINRNEAESRFLVSPQKLGQAFRVTCENLRRALGVLDANGVVRFYPLPQSLVLEQGVVQVAISLR